MNNKKVINGMLLATGLLFAACMATYYLHASSFTGPLLIAALILLALSFRQFSKLKGFAYSVWILAAVALAMFHPSYFNSAQGFQFKILIVPFVQLTMFGMGAHMSINDFKQVVKMPKGVLIGIFSHYTMMPLIAFSLSRLFNFPPEIAGGVILIGCVPSAMASNVMSYLAKANLALAVTIGACSTMLSPFVTPILMKFFGGQYIVVDVTHMMLDITNMIIIPIVAGFIFNLFYFGAEHRKAKFVQLTIFFSIILITNIMLMYAAGLSLGQFAANFARSIFWFYLLPMLGAVVFTKFKVPRPTIEKGLSFAAMLGIVINTIIITASGRDNLIQVGGLLIITCLMHNVAGFVIGYSFAKLLGLPEKDRRTVAFEVGMQNGGVATGLALQMGKVATVGLASAIFGPLQNITGSALANWFKKRLPEDTPPVSEKEIEEKPSKQEVTSL